MASDTASDKALPPMPPPGSPGRRRALTGDVVVGVSVALVLVPQAVAYAALAGLPPAAGLLAAAIAPLPASLLASSRYLQVGPTALTSFQTLAALTAAAPALAQGSIEYAAAAALLSLLCSLIRVAAAAGGGGRAAERVPHTVLEGFTVASSTIIASTQLAGIVGVRVPHHLHGVGSVAYVLTHPGDWTVGAVALSAATAAVVLGARRVHPLLPGALLAAALGVGVQLAGGAVGPVVGTVALPPWDPASGVRALVALPWELAPALAPAAAAMALAGFVESASVSRRFARADGAAWSGTRELASEGVAGLSAVLGGAALPVGGSFSRTTLARTLGARSRAAGAFTGLAAAAFLVTPGALTHALAPLPRAVLAALVTLAVAPLIRPPPAMGRSALTGDARARWGAVTAWGTTAATFLSEPRLEYGLLAGLLLAATGELVAAAAAALRSRGAGTPAGGPASAAP